MYELAAHVRATPLRRALNSHPVNIINVFFMVYLLSDFYCTTAWINKYINKLELACIINY